MSGNRSFDSSASMPPTSREGAASGGRRPSAAQLGRSQQHVATIPAAERRPPLCVNMKTANSSASRRWVSATQPPLTGGMARGDIADELDNRGWHDLEIDPRTPAPWATVEDFTPVGIENAFTPASMKNSGGYFPSVEMQGLDAALEQLTMEEEDAIGPDEVLNIPPTAAAASTGFDGRPGARARMQSAPAMLANRPIVRHSVLTPVEPSPMRYYHGETRRQTLPKLDTAAPAMNRVSLNSAYAHPRQASPAPLLRAPHPQADTPTTPNGHRNSLSSMVSRRSATRVLARGVGTAKSWLDKAKATARRASVPAYQEPPSLAEHALAQPCVGHPEDFLDGASGRGIGCMSPTSVEHLYRATASSAAVTAEQRARAAISFTARQQVHGTQEARAQAELTRREIERERAAAAAGGAARGKGTRMTHEERARTWVAEEKDTAERMALQDPGLYPGLRRY